MFENVLKSHKNNSFFSLSLELKHLSFFNIINVVSLPSDIIINMKEKTSILINGTNVI